MATITTTIGTSSRDYSTLSAWEADLDNGAVYSASDDAVGEIYNDSTFTDQSFAIDGGSTIGLTTITLRPATGEGHDGTAGSGVLMQMTATTEATAIDISGTVPTHVSHIEIDYNGQSLGQGYIGVRMTNALHTTSRVILHHMQELLGDDAQSGIARVGNDANILNNIIYRFHGGNNAESILVGGNASADIICTNNVVFECSAENSTAPMNFDNTSTSTVCVNNISINPTHGLDINWDVAFTGSGGYNISLDTTADLFGSNNITGVASGDQFVSIVDGSEDLHLKAGSDAIGAGYDLGTTPTFVNIDIDGRDRDAEGDVWDIGADQFVSAVASNSRPGFIIMTEF